MLKLLIFVYLLLATQALAQKATNQQTPAQQVTNQQTQQTTAQQITNQQTQQTTNQNIQSFIQQMSDKEKIAQLLIIGIQTQKMYDQIFKVFYPGGFIDYRNFQKDLNKEWFKNRDALQKKLLKQTKLLSFYMVNQEGGDISRFKKQWFKQTDLNTSYWDIPGPLKLASIKDLKQVEEFAFEMGKLLLTLGINMNLAPVVDVFNPKINGYIRGRSFSSYPLEVKQTSHAFTRGLQKAGVIATFKHFPGYTNSVLNSHKKLVTIDLPKKDFINKHWIPYEFKTGFSYPKAIMSNIALYPQLDNKQTAPLSKKIITGVLKTRVRL